MKTSLVAIFFLSLVLMGCNNRPATETAIIVQDTSDAYDNTPRNYYEEVMLEDDIVYYSLHYFSDSLAGDSFVVEMPTGNIIGGSYFVRIYNAAGKCVFTDSVATYHVFNSISTERDSVTEEQLLAMLDRYLADVVSNGHFSEAGKVEAIKNAGASDIRNMIGWNEAVADPAMPVFTYDIQGGTAQICYSHKLNRPVIIVQTYDEYEGD